MYATYRRKCNRQGRGNIVTKEEADLHHEQEGRMDRGRAIGDAGGNEEEEIRKIAKGRSGSKRE